MNKGPLSTALVAAVFATAMSAGALADDFGFGRPLTVAVFGDWPYNQLLLDNAPLLINSINADRDVSFVIHVGDIHSGSQPCTSADTLPPIATSNPGWNQKIFHQFQQLRDPVVYTPGDNEWTDCHKTNQKSSGYPLLELASVRSLFFSQPGRTLGLQDRFVFSQAKVFDPAYKADSEFVENVMWVDSRVVFVTLNVPGSNNDTLPWTGIFSDPTAQADEVEKRNGANERWLDAAFKLASFTRAKAVVIALQADMWDPAQLPNNLTAYTPLVQQIADLTVGFAGPVLLLNGDSHVYNGLEHPLADPSSAQGQIHDTQAVPNLTRITVQGSTTAPAEWLKLTIDPRSASVFGAVNVPYCKDPSTTCQF